MGKVIKEMPTQGAPEAAPDPPPSRSSNVDVLVSSAERWIRQALDGWAEEDHASVAMLAPIAVEHLGKAMLWNRNPALLVPLASNSEESLRILTETPDLANTKLRTISLTTVLQRVERRVSTFPLTQQGVRNFVDARNGAVHVGSARQSTSVLRDALSLCSVLLADLDIDGKAFYGDQYYYVQGILDEQQSEIEATVAAKMARARNHLAVLEEKLGRPLFDDTMATLEAEARFSIDPPVDAFSDTVAIDYDCPECASRGRLIGRLDAEAEAEWDVEKIGDSYEPYVSGVDWLLSLSPQSFECNVCKLMLDGRDELTAARLPASIYTIPLDDLDDDFDLDAYTRLRYADYD